MSSGKLTIYNASAGSGKTYTLTGIYLAYLFKGRHNYRKILAVTFTNKATAEMKSRILENLHLLSSGEKSEYLDELVLSTGHSKEKIRQEAGEILNSILHDYSRFSVSTIDTFFQKILRAFAREAGLHSGYNIEIDHKIILSAAVDDMISSVATDDQLRRWLTNYAISNIDDGKSWNPRNSIMKLSEEIFREKFKLLSQGEIQKLEDKDFLQDYIKKIRAVSSDFEKSLTVYGNAALKIFHEFDLADDMFYRKGQGIPRYIRALDSGEICEPNSYVREIFSEPPRWSTGAQATNLAAAIGAGLDKILRDAITFYDGNIINYRTSKVISQNIYALGILSDVMRKVREIASSSNTFLLSDAGEFLNLITKNDQSPFIYEKAGNRFENFMIDEFQDTSRIQWNNFEPLIENSLAQGNDNLVVGDVKQSIYRWRNSDWTILESMLGSKSERLLSMPLKVNWRSCPGIINFNNDLFTVLPYLLEQKFAHEGIPSNFREMYSQAVQVDPGKRTGGYVRIEFVGNDEGKKWKEKVLESIPGVIGSLQDKGYRASDIGIIVRDGNEGSMVLKTLIDHSAKHTSENAGRYNFNVVSNDSLLLSNSPVVNFIVSCLNVINDPTDPISRAALNRFYTLSKADAAEISGEEVSVLPEAWETMLAELGRKALFEAVERIVSYFELGRNSANAAYINAFQDLVLSFAGNNTPDIRSFLEWWEETGCRKSLSVPGNQDALRILTIHKSKGLEFRVVILPFISWNLDHRPGKQPLLWVRPDAAPFDGLGIVPVKCVKDLAGTIFSEYYFEE
ncbi:MAG TPA: UvrD-helicase domain-containing protein, partial [Bacteroidales bacterium]|nr:UvrD-helicase domain-containing protein [Bacteroidales bacterium]